ncbi:MAG: RNA polymerase sigma factor [endosymbiont of Galathealinum brachiosum]|uniref:RNA polymerase sigma factor n=1 Tax=endosymbiont of Galathealinum brachiosum TaxID=2200906 RepID=A0A370D994_9GAMM|nr:MAG: RNA polymerase sigma factor [endosymbiont of Galathealinum brachiosum]
MNSFSSNDIDNLTDEDLMLSYRDGTAAAFDVLYARHKGGLYRYVLRQLNNREEIANEIFQDVWMKLINARSNYQVTAKFSTWLYHLAHNRLVDYWRSEKHLKYQVEFEETAESQVTDVSIESQSSQPQVDLQQGQMRQQIKQAIAALPEEQRSAILLKEEAALSLAEIAEVTGVNRETVKSRLRYGIKRLRGILHPLRPVS